MQDIQGFDTMNTKNKLWGVSIVSTVVLICLMLIYLAMTIWSSNELAGRTEIISEHPFEVVIATGDLHTCVAEMRIGMEHLTSHRSAEDVELERLSLDEIYLAAEEPFAKIETLYLGNPQNVTDLKQVMEQLRQEQETCLVYAGQEEHSFDDIEQYQKDHLYILYDQATQLLNEMTKSAQNKTVHYGESAEALRKGTLIGSVILMWFMLMVLMISNYIQRRQKRELERRSQLFDNLSTSIDDAFLIRDAYTEKIYYTGLNIKRVLGYDVKKLDDIYQGFRPEDARKIRESVNHGNFDSPLTYTVEYTLPNGEKRWMSVRIYKSDFIKTHEVISVLSDCTDEITSRQALQDALLNAERANAAKSEFLSRMSHEIRTPLNAVIGMTTIASESLQSPEKVEECLNTINLSSRHLLMLINDVLDMSKIESAKMALQREPFDLSQVIGGFISTISAQAKAKGVALQTSMEGFGDQKQYIGDSLRLSQILFNLGSNAVKFTASGGRVEFTASRIASGYSADTLRFVVKDSGIGMTREALERIFEPFEQADETIAGRFGGTGLGMSITRNLVTLMSGRIEIQSEPDLGTTCIVDLPMLRDENAGTGTETTADASVEADRPQLSEKRILVAEDNEINKEILVELLGMRGMETEWAKDGSEALSAFLASEPGHFDAILMDIQMPVMNGYEATRQIRMSGHADARKIPIIATTANAFSDDISAALAAGMNTHVSKPIDIDQLCRVLEKELSDQ